MKVPHQQEAKGMDSLTMETLSVCNKGTNLLRLYYMHGPAYKSVSSDVVYCATNGNSPKLTGSPSTEQFLH